MNRRPEETATAQASSTFFYTLSSLCCKNRNTHTKIEDEEEEEEKGKRLYNKPEKRREKKYFSRSTPSITNVHSRSLFAAGAETNIHPADTEADADVSSASFM